MHKVTYNREQRARAKADKKPLCCIDTPTLGFGGPCTEQEWHEITAFLTGFLDRRMERRKADRLHGEQLHEGEVSGG